MTQSATAPAAGRHPFDILGDVLETLRFRGTLFFRSQLAAPWGMALQAVPAPRFHIALQGDCVVGAGDRKAPIRLREMEVLLLPHGDMHWIADHPGRKLVPSERAGRACELGRPLFQEGRITNKLMCGIVHYETAMSHPLLDALPQVMHFTGIGAEEPLWTTIRLIDTEMERGIASPNALVDRLTEVLFLQLLYRYVGEHPELPGFLLALSDRRLRRLLELIHRHPARPWTLESLGREVGMSRATVARRFGQVVGMPPLQYLSNWRLMKAHHLVSQSSLSLEAIAAAVGFGGGSALSRAFRRRYGYTPTQLRRGAVPKPEGSG